MYVYACIENVQLPRANRNIPIIYQVRLNENSAMREATQVLKTVYFFIYVRSTSAYDYTCMYIYIQCVLLVLLAMMAMTMMMMMIMCIISSTHNNIWMLHLRSDALEHLPYRVKFYFMCSVHVYKTIYNALKTRLLLIA